MKMKTLDFRKIRNKYMMEFILVILVLLLTLFAKGFATTPNILGILRNVAITGVIAFGMTMTIIGGEIDLSIGSSIALSAVMTATVTGIIAGAEILSMDYAVIVGMLVALIIGGPLAF